MLTTAVARQLQLLSDDPDRGDRLAASFGQLCTDLTAAVPSCVAVSIVLVRPGSEVVFNAAVEGPDTPVVLASLAVPLSAAPASTLILRAGEAGAFLLLADDLAARLESGSQTIAVDQHLSIPGETAGSTTTAALAELQTVNQAIGVQLDHGSTPEEALSELRQRARESGATLGAVAQLLLDTIPAPESRR